ncbi:MAG: DUF4325 domain-containing protein [Bacteroidota bacterium]
MANIKARERNIIAIDGTPGLQHTRFASQSLHIVIDEKGFTDVELDFSDCKALFPNFMLPLIALCRDRRKSDNIEFTIKLPESKDLQSLFHNANWSYLLNDRLYKPTTYRGGIHVPAIAFNDFTEQSEAVDSVTNMLMGQLDSIELKDLGALDWCVQEITENVLNHAECPSGGIIQASVYSKNQEVEIIVSDAGIGVAKSLGISDHRKALEECILEDRTRDKNNNQGNGLFGSFEIAVESGGIFSITSGKATLIAKSIDDKQWLTPESNSFYKGTSVSTKINCSDPDLIAKALKFRGKIHEPQFGYIDSKFFKSDLGEYHFNLKSDIVSFANRHYGKVAFNKILRILEQSEGSPVAIDFEGIRIISSSFADEAFGKLFAKIGPIRFHQQIKLKNMNPNISGLIDLAITKRFISNNGSATTQE